MLRALVGAFFKIFLIKFRKPNYLYFAIQIKLTITFPLSFSIYGLNILSIKMKSIYIKIILRERLS